MEGEINNFIMVWASIFASICYCYAAAKVIPKGTARLITFFPVVCLFVLLPLNLHSINLGLPTVFFITWLANFKILLFAFGVGPLSDPSVSLGRFVALACLPIKIQKSPTPKPHSSPFRQRLDVNNYAAKTLVLSFVVFLNGYCRNYLHPNVVLFLICVFIFIGMEFLVVAAGILGGVMLGSEIEPQFKDPYHSTSLQDFWGRRWNLMVSDILRSTVYNPVRHLSTPILGWEWAIVPAILGTFLVSGLMHELIFYYMGRLRPTWGTTLCFLIHGLWYVAEIFLKKKLSGKWRLPTLISRLLTFGFGIFTLTWLSMPQLQMFEIDLKTLEEYMIVVTFAMDLGRASILRFLNICS